MKRSGTSHVGVVLLVSVALGGGVESALAQPPGEAPGLASTPAPVQAAQHHKIVLRSWQDRVKLDGRDQDRRIEIVFDYESGLTRRLVYDARDRLISEEALAEQPRATPAEIEKAFDTVRRDPELGRLARQSDIVVDGGFLLREAPGKPCGPTTRCAGSRLAASI